MRSRLDARLDVALHASGDALHIEEQAADQDRRDEREDPLPERLVLGLREEQAGPEAGEHGDGGAEVHGAGEGLPAGAPQVREDERDDEERLDPLAQRDRKTLPHGCGLLPGV